MTIKLPRVIEEYVTASNKHDVESILSCFWDDAVVHDEGEELRGIDAIKGWTVKTIEQYKFQFKPLSVKNDEGEVVVAVEVSGTFDGSPVTLDYHFAIESDKISSLTIDQAAASKRDCNTQEGCRNGGGILVRAFVLTGKQFFQLSLQVSCSTILFCGFECIHGRSVVFPEFIDER